MCRSGSPVDLDEIDIAGIQGSRAIIVLAPEVDEPDIEVIKTILAITNDPNRRAAPYHVVAEIHDPANLEAARLVGRDEVELIAVGDVVARIIAQTCRQAGLSIVYGELLDFDGDEIYFSRQPTLDGQTFGDAQLAFEDSTLIGIANPDGVRLNPPAATVIGPGERLILIAADDDAIHLREGVPAPVDDGAIIVCVPTPRRTRGDARARVEPARPADRARARFVRRAGLGADRRHRRSRRRRRARSAPPGACEPGAAVRGRILIDACRPRFARHRARTSTSSS